MDKQKEVKKILRNAIATHNGSAFSSLDVDNLAHQICQLFQEPEPCPECKGTVMTREDIRASNLEKGLIGVAQKQAELSYKAGYIKGIDWGLAEGQKAGYEAGKKVADDFTVGHIDAARIQGMQKVVDWIEKHKGYYTGDDTFTMLEFLWQQFLKDNNLKEAL